MYIYINMFVCGCIIILCVFICLCVLCYDFLCFGMFVCIVVQLMFVFWFVFDSSFLRVVFKRCCGMNVCLEYGLYGWLGELVLSGGFLCLFGIYVYVMAPWERPESKLYIIFLKVIWFCCGNDGGIFRKFHGRILYNVQWCKNKPVFFEMVV